MKTEIRNPPRIELQSAGNKSSTASELKVLSNSRSGKTVVLNGITYELLE